MYFPARPLDDNKSKMASRALTCKRCQWIFTFSDPKPTFPPNGVELVCPHCKAKFTYRRYELIYQKSTLEPS
jgi:rubredoxin